MKKVELIYCIPGLGLDHRIFTKLKISNARLIYLDWLEPLPNETLTAYSKRFSKQIPEDEFCLLGHSMGGMVAIEIAKIKSVKHLFLISSVKNNTEIPNRLKWLDKLPTSSGPTTKLAIEASIALKPYYDRTDKAGLSLFQKMAKDASINFISWAIKEVAHWNFNEALKTPFSHFHGTEDLIFPIKNIDLATTIKNGTHYMIYNDAERISDLIGEQIRKIK